MSSAKSLSEDDLVDMMHLLDSDGDGTVTKDEFKEFFMRLKGWTEDERFQKEWKRIDNNGDNILQLSELCDYYGVSTKAVEAGCARRRDMTDDEVLEALQRQAELYTSMLEMKAKAKEEALRHANMRNAAGVRTGCTLVQIGSSQVGVNATGSESQSISIMEMIQIGEIAAFEALIKADVDSKINLRIEDEKGEMPIHKLARKGADTTLRLVLQHMDHETRQYDVNAMDKNGMSPIFHASVPQKELRGIPEGWIKNFGVITTLEAFGADMFFTSSTVGWSVLHHCAHNDAYEAAKEVIHLLKEVRNTPESKLFTFVNAVGLRDKRSALHVAAFRCELPLVELLLQTGADGLLEDAHGKTPLDLASKANKRLVVKAINKHLGRE
mmetsp:Transcript_64466/g.127328  ORF Transcript_64466/g.127328 Transcript_64466/m.127328 type:complete len:383 (-) Transcript_64466:269-1417(-)